MQNLAAFVAQLLLFVSFFAAVVDDISDKRHSIESNGFHNLRRFGEINRFTVKNKLVRALLDCCFGFIHKLKHAVAAGSGNSLIRRNDKTLKSESVRQSLDNRHACHGRAVRIRNDFRGNNVQIVRIYFRDNQRNIVMKTPLRGVVYNKRACLSKFGSPLFRRAAARRENCDINAAQIGFFYIFNFNLMSAPFNFLACRVRRSDKTQIANRKIAFVKNAAHDHADLSGRSEHRDVDSFFVYKRH